MACLAAFAFTSAVQGWFITKNKIWEVPFLLVTSFVLFRPETLVKLFHLPESMKYYMYFVGVGLLVLIYLEQKMRIKAGAPT